MRRIQQLSTIVVLTGLLAAGSAAGAATSRSSHPKAVRAAGYTCTVVGTPKADKLVGHAGDVVCGLGGNDTLTATGSGTVVLIAGTGNVTIVASKTRGANDIIIGGKGHDAVVGGAGNDTVNVGQGTTTVAAGTATTTVDESNGSSSLSCAAPGGTVVIVGAGADDHEGNCSNDTVVQAGLRLSGTVTAVGATTIDVAYSHVSDAAVSWLAANGNPTTVTVDVSSATVVRDGGGSIAVGDTVRVAANAPASGTTLTGVYVHASSVSAAPAEDGPSATFEFQGAVTAVTATTLTLAYREVNDAGLSWLAANGNPSAVIVEISAAQVNRRGGGAVAVGDRAEVAANAPASGTTLVGVNVEAAPAPTGGEHHATHLEFIGSVTAVDATTVTVQPAESNDAAQTWLAANGNPATVVVDTTAAQIERAGGGSLTVGDRIAVGATVPTSGTVLVAGTIEAAPAGGHHGGDQSGALETQGTVTAAGATSMTVTVGDANHAASTWLSANGNLTSVAVNLSNAQIHRAGGGSVQTGDRVAFSASAPVSGTTLVGVDVHAAPAGGNGQGEGDGHGQGGGQGNGGNPATQGLLAGPVTAVGATTITMTIVQVSPNVAAYLSTNANPTSVTVDLSSAKVFRDHGGVITVGDLVAVTAPIPASGVTFAASVVIAEPASSHHGGDGH